MGDVQRCVKCGNDRLAATMVNGVPLCNEHAGLPTVADRLKDLAEENQESLMMLRNRMLMEFSDAERTGQTRLRETPPAD